MKKILLFSMLLFSIWSFAQDYYSQQWAKIEQGVKQGNYKSNLPILKEIKNQAMKDKKTVELVKALKGELSVAQMTEDDTKNDIVSQFYGKLSEVENTLKGEDLQFFKVLMLEYFLDNYNENQWQINRRTNLDNQDLKSIETWTKLDYKKYISQKLTELDKESATLKNIKLEKYETIFDYKNYSKEYYGSAYNWLMMKKIGFLTNTSLFTPDEIKTNKKEADLIFNNLIDTNVGNAKLYFQHQQVMTDCNAGQCQDLLEKLQKLYNSSINGDYKLMIASDIISQLDAKDKKVEALKVASEAKAKYPKSQFIGNITNLENNIINPNLNISYDVQTQANKPIHVSVNAKNVNNLWIEIYEVADVSQFLKFVNDQYNNPFSKIKKKFVRKEQYQLINPKDYENHITSVEMKPVPAGLYVAKFFIDGKESEDFHFIASDIRAVYQSKKTDTPQIKIVSSDNGKPYPNAEIKLFQFNRQTTINPNNVTADKDGMFVLPTVTDRNYNSYLVQLDGGNNYTFLASERGGNYRTTSRDTESFSQIFLDRKIYRPGQLVYFKVIAKTALNEKMVLNKGIKQTIKLFDANQQEIGSQEFTTNDFGSYHGSFTLPQGKLNGSFNLSVNGEAGAYETFNVEEHKRPKFEVTFEPVKEEYQYGKTIQLKGKAMMFSGVPLSNSTVNYEIKKQDIRWRYFWWYPQNDNNQNSIIGEVKTNEQGEFVIPVTLVKENADKGISVDGYKINASVTDINGETQSSSTSINVASVSHYLEVSDIKDRMTDNDLEVIITPKNYNNQPLKKSYNVKLIKLVEPNRVLRRNFRNNVQDLPIYSELEFIQKFPHDLFSKEDSTEKWKEEKTVKTELNRTDTSINFGKLDAGQYRLLVYNIEGNDTIKSQKDFKVWSPRGLAKDQKPFLNVIQPQTEYKRGEKASFLIYSAIPDVWINIYVQNGRGGLTTSHQKLVNGFLKYVVEVPKDEKISMLNVQFQVVGLNDIQTENKNIEIAETKKPLKIETITFRDKLQPNQEEKWTIKILGEDKEKVNAEVLASMYDQSLDQFAANSWTWNQYTSSIFYDSYSIYKNLGRQYFNGTVKYSDEKEISIPEFRWFDGRILNNYSIRGTSSIRGRATTIEEVAVIGYSKKSKSAPTSANVAYESVAAVADSAVAVEAPDEKLDKVQVRQNLNETAFFYPNLLTDKEGNVQFEFTSPEALTKWKLMFLAHTQDLRAAILNKEVVTQKEFSVTPNYPRFLREGDELLLQTKLSSLVNQKLAGTVQLQVLDAVTNADISNLFDLKDLQKSFNLNENGNTVADWKIKVPNNVSSIILKVVAKAGNFSDGEQKAIAVLPNRMLVTDALPIFVKEGQTKTFVLDALKNNSSKTLTNVANTLELSTNPIWEIMFALPSLREDQSSSADVVFNKWFASVLASEIFRANPRLKSVFDEYQSKGLLVSNLEKNQELKQLLLEETPWILESKSETEQMQKLARIFDVNSMRNSIQSDWAELQRLQNSDGGFSWYQGYPSSYYSSLYILKNLGRINEWLKDNVKDYQSSEQKKMVADLVDYVDNQIDNYWRTDKENVWTNFTIDYLDTRHYWEKDFPLKNRGLKLKNQVIAKAKTADIKDFTFFGLHRAAILFNDYNLKNVSAKLMTYLKETSTQSETQGVYWKQNFSDWGWYNTNYINQAGALEAFQKLNPQDQNFIEELKIWLITQKEVNSWGSSRGTAEVIFTILNSGKSWTTTESDRAEITWGGKTLDPQTQATGYVKQSITKDEVDKDLSTVTVKKSSPGIVQGGLFWQYYEDLNKIKSSESYISITKELYKKVKTVNGEELQKISNETPLKIGDKVTVRMILNTDRNMEFIHLKDMRAAGFEPLNVLSGYQWKNNLGYYQSTKDASTNFYIEYMPKGKYVFEYDYVCNAAGKFSNGITTLQNYYAPQMNAHTQGSSVEITQ